MRAAARSALISALAFFPYAALAEGPPAAQAVTHLLAKTSVTTSGQPIALPSGPVDVVATTIEVAAGAALPTHKHPFPRLGYVLQGTLRVVNEQTGHAHTFTHGDFVVEDVDQWHRGSNVGNGPLQVLVIDLVRKGAGNTIGK